jgi:glycosyltransferase involved in cell wall biosynthesis
MISVADAMTDLMVSAGVAPRDKFTTIYSGMEVEPFLRADESRAQIRSQLGYADEHVVVGKIARLFHLKGHEYVVRAARQVIAQQGNVRFLFVGDGILANSIRDQVERAGLKPYFQFTGLVPQEQVPGLIETTALLGVPERADPGLVASACEFILEGLHVQQKIDRTEQRGYVGTPKAERKPRDEAHGPPPGRRRGYN